MAVDVEKDELPLQAAAAAVAAATNTKPMDGASPDTSTELPGAINKETDAAVDTPKSSKKKPAKSDISDEPEGQAGLGNFWRILSYSTILDKCLMAVAFFFAAAAGVALPSMLIVFGRLVGDFTNFTAFSASDFQDSLSNNALIFVYLFIGKICATYVSMFCFRMSGIRISATLRLAYLKALFHQPVKVLDKLPTGETTDLITSAANTIQYGISDKLSILTQSLATVISAYVIAFTYNWTLTLISSTTIVFIMVVYSFTTPVYIKNESSVTFAKSKTSTIAGEVFTSIRTVFSLGAEDAMKARFAEWIDEGRKRGLKMSLNLAIQLSPAFFSIYANNALTFWYGVRMLNDGRIDSIQTVIICLFSILIVVGILGQVVNPLMAIFKAAAASTGFWKIIDSPEMFHGGLKEPDASPHEDIVFENVCFAYPSRPEAAVLKDLNMTVPARKITAIVGPSGSGKSTIVGLMERWYQLTDVNERIVEKKKEATEGTLDEGKKKKKFNKGKKAEEERHDSPTDSEMSQAAEELKPIIQNSGTIRVGDHNVESLDVKWWRSQIGLVQQEPFLFNDTIYKNVVMGLTGSKWEYEDESTKRELVEEACLEAFADEFIRKLPKGYDTMIGESGIKLSGGQRQRLAIARSIIKKPPILILDEATSAIDVKGEKIVQAALDRASQNRTTITIAHRLSTIKKADQIVVIKDGVAVERGTHEALLENTEGIYYGLVNAQSLELGMEAEEVEHDDDLVMELTRTKSKPGEPTDDSSSVEEDKYKNKGIFSTVGKFLYEQRHHSVLYGLMVLAAGMIGGVFAVNCYVFAQIVNVFQLRGQRLIDRGNFWALMFFILAIVNGIGYAIIGYVANMIATHVSTTYRQEYFESILAKPIVFYDDDSNSSGTLTSRVSGDPEQLRELLGVNIAFPLIAFFSILGSIIIAFVFGWKLTLVIFFGALPVILLANFMRVRYEMQFEKMNSKVFSESSQFAAESIRAFRTVTSLTLENPIIERYDSLLKEHVHKAFLRARLAALIFALSESMELPCMALAFWYGGQLLARGEYDLVQFFVIYTAIIQGGQQTGQFLSMGPNLANATAAANRILAFRNKPATDDDKTPPSWNHPPAGGEQQKGVRIEFKDVSFQYATRPIPVFRHLSLAVEPGQFVAFVGPSGCGKTTIISLLERFYDVGSGSISIDGVDIRSVSPRKYRRPVALVSQEPTLFEGTIRSNLLLGLPRDEPEPSDEQIHAATSAASLHTFIESLPQSYATPISASVHANLSGGQRQRLCIARALLRKPRLLLLDEATSSLDSRSEREVQEALETVVAGREMTVCVVAHRLATVQRADKIFVLGEGEGRGARVVEVGTHKELVGRKGTYYSMCQAQALDR